MQYLVVVDCTEEDSNLEEVENIIQCFADDSSASSGSSSSDKKKTKKKERFIEDEEGKEGCPKEKEEDLKEGEKDQGYQGLLSDM